MNGLQAAVARRPFERDGFDRTTGARRFLGWTLERHWLLPERREVPTASPSDATT